MVKLDMNNIKSVEILRHSGCIGLTDSKENSDTICYPAISDAIIKGANIEVTEFHRVPRGGSLELDIYFDKPVACSIDKNILRCPVEAKLSFEK